MSKGYETRVGGGRFLAKLEEETRGGDHVTVSAIRVPRHNYFTVDIGYLDIGASLREPYGSCVFRMTHKEAIAASKMFKELAMYLKKEGA